MPWREKVLSAHCPVSRDGSFSSSVNTSSTATGYLFFSDTKVFRLKVFRLTIVENSCPMTRLFVDSVAIISLLHASHGHGNCLCRSIVSRIHIGVFKPSSISGSDPRIELEISTVSVIVRSYLQPRQDELKSPDLTLVECCAIIPT